MSSEVLEFIAGVALWLIGLRVVGVASLARVGDAWLECGRYWSSRKAYKKARNEFLETPGVKGFLVVPAPREIFK